MYLRLFDDCLKQYTNLFFEMFKNKKRTNLMCFQKEQIALHISLFALV